MGWGAFRQDFRLSVFHAALLRNASGQLERQGPNMPQPDASHFTQASQVAERAERAEPVRAGLGEAFQALTAGPQRSDVRHVNAANEPETRVARVLGFHECSLASQGVQER